MLVLPNILHLYLNHEFLIDIFYEIHKMDKNTELLLFGDGPLRQNIEIKDKNLKLESNVKFMGIKQNINEYMQAMDIFLLPSFYEGLPVVGVEAQTSGLSCIFSTYVTVGHLRIKVILYFCPFYVFHKKYLLKTHDFSGLQIYLHVQLQICLLNFLFF